MMPLEQDLVLGVIGVQLGFLTPEDVLGAARELMPPSRRSLAQVLESRGVLASAQREVLERLAARAVAETGSAAQTLELLPPQVRALLAESAPARMTPSRPLPAREQVCVEQPGRYQPTTAGAHLRHDSVFGRDVAWLEAQDEEDEPRLLAEARLAAQLDHPAVLPVFEAGRSSDGVLYVTTQRPGTRTLETATVELATAPERMTLVPSLLMVCQCIAAAHARGFTHGALTARSIILGTFGEVYVTGWAAPGPPASPTSAAFTQAARADLSALGALLHELLTGLPPPVSGVVEARGAPGDLLAVAHGALKGTGAIDSVEVLAREVRAWLDGRRVASHHYSAWQLVRRYAARNRAFVVVAAGALALLVAVASLTLGRMGQERDRARHFAEVFLDDVGKKLRALPGVEPLLEQVTTRAIAHYQRSTELERAPHEERLRVARALARLAGLSTELGRLDEAARSADFAWSLVESVTREDALDVGALEVGTDLLITRSRLALARNVVPQARALARQATVMADDAVARSGQSLEAVDLAVRARLRLAEVAEHDEARAAMARVIELATAASRKSPNDVDALRLFSVALAAKAAAAHEDAPGSGGELLEEALAVARRAAEPRPEDDELQVLLSERLAALGAFERSRGHEEDARPLLEDARARSLDLLRHTPGHVGARQALVAIEVQLRHYDAAWQLARALEAQGQVARVDLAPLASLLAGHFDDATRLASRPDARPATVLVHALAEAMLGRPANAVVQARGLRGRVDQLEWPAGAGAALTVSPQAGAAERAAVDFAQALDEPGQARGAALEAFIRALEAALPGR